MGHVEHDVQKLIPRLLSAETFPALPQNPYGALHRLPETVSNVLP